MRKGFFLTALFILLALVPAALADNGFPGDCEAAGAAYQLPGVFPRYEAHNQRLVLVNWNTGEDVRVIETGLAAPEFQITGWSSDCHYLAGAIGSADEAGLVHWNTIIWDAMTSTRVGTFEDARRVPYPLTWDPTSAYLLVETRNGALVWHIASGSRVQLTSEADGAARSFRPGSVQWDLGNGQLHAVLAITPFGASVTYNLQTGELVSVVNRFGDAVPTDAPGVRLAQVSDEGYFNCQEVRYRWGDGYYRPHNLRPLYQSYNHRIVLMEPSTREVVQVLEANIEASGFRALSWSPQCRYLAGFVPGEGIFVWDMEAGARIGVFAESSGSIHWDPSLTYLLLVKRRGVFLWNLSTNQQMQLTEEYPSFAYFDWDLEHGHLIATRWGASQAIFDLQTGEQLGNISSFAVDIPGGRFPFASANGYYGCIYTFYGGFYQPTNVRPRYNHRAQAFLLQGRVNGQPDQIVESSLDTSYFNILGWSPNCQYVAAALDSEANGRIAVWDTVNNHRIATLEGTQARTGSIYWDPTNQFVAVETWHGGYVLNLETGQQMLVNPNTDADGHNFHYVQWDMVRGQLLASPIGAGNTVAAFDLGSGQQVATFHNGDRAAPVYFLRSPDNRQLLLATSPSLERDERPNGLALWDRDTQAGVQLTMEPYIAPGSYNTAISEHYLVIGGATRIFVWDLSSLSGGGPYPPTFIHLLSSTRRPRFVSEYVIQTSEVSVNRFQAARRQYTFTVYHWDVRTGELLSEVSETRSYSRGGYCCLED